MANPGDFTRLQLDGVKQEVLTPAQVTQAITYLQSGTGGTARSVQDRLRDWVSIRDFSNDAAGISAALTAHPGVCAPAGTYNTTTARTIGSGKHLELAPGAVLTSSGGGSWAMAAGGSVHSYTEGASGDVHYWGRKLTGTKSIGAGPFEGYSPSGFMFDIRDDDADADADFMLGFRFRHIFGGSAAKGGREGLSSALTHTSPTNSANANRNYVAVQGKTTSQGGDGGTNTGAGAKGQYFGGGFAAYAEAGAANLYHTTGAEFNTFMQAGSSTRYTDGLAVAGCNSVHGAETDAGIAITAQGAVGVYGPHVGWNHGILFTNRSGADPLHSGSTLLGSYWSGGGAKTISRGVDLSGFAITDEIIKSQYAKWTTGTLTLGDAAGEALIEVIGPSANSNLRLRTAGSGSAHVQDGSQRTIAQFTRFASTGTANFIELVNNNSGASPVVAASGGDTNINLTLQPKGTGLVALSYASAAAGTPASFSAARLFALNLGGTIVYVPCTTVPW